jgi:hypothetical protein
MERRGGGRREEERRGEERVYGRYLGIEICELETGIGVASYMLCLPP